MSQEGPQCRVRQKACIIFGHDTSQLASATASCSFFLEQIKQFEQALLKEGLSGNAGRAIRHCHPVPATMIPKNKKAKF